MIGFDSNKAAAPLTLLLFGCFMVASLAAPRRLHAQDDNATTDRERATVDRYMQVLLRRPRPGVALDRVYGYHVQNDSLDQLETQLTDSAAADNADDAGAKQMVWGLIQLQRGRSAEAAEILTKVESLLSDDAACSYYLGRAYMAVGQTEKAAAAMERAIERGPSRTEALPMFTELGRIYSRAGEREKSLSVWTRLEKLFPGDTRVGGQIARTLAEEGQYEEAKSRYERLSNTSRKPDEKIAFAVEAAEMQRNLGQAEEATALLEKILARLRPGSWLYTDVRNRIESGFTKSGDYDGLADYYQKQLDARPDDLALRIRLSRIMVTAGRLNEAKTLLETAIDQAPNDLEARLTLIDVLVNQDEIASASDQFAELAKRDPENPDHLVRWGQILLDDTDTPLEDRRSAAAKVWSRLADARQDDPVTLSQVADRFRSIDRSEDAIKLYRKSIELDPGSPQYREYLGEYLYTLNRKEDAIEVWQSIAADDRKNRDSLVRLAEVYGAFELPDRAIGAWKEASEFDLTFVQELRYAAKLAEAKQYEEALNRLDLAASIAETPDEQEQLLKDRIGIYQSSGTLEEQIRKVSAEPESAVNLRRLALMHSASGDLISAERSIQKAIAMAPEDTDVLLVAADLAERQNRFVDAAKLFEKLSLTDNRFRSNYLQRVASLQIRLGQSEDAIETCEAIVDANPASPESYLFFARTAFSINRDEEAIAALRRAMSVAPRDNSPRRMLAGHFADRFRTDEAIELYWQAFNFETETDNKIGVIRSLSPLYDRKADLDSLIRRIEEINRKDGDTRTTGLMVASAYEAVQDYGSARSTIDQLLANQPRDVSLLETMVRLSDGADEVDAAATYQKRITELANTPENRFKLIQYQLEAGTIDVAQALTERMSFLSDPSRLGNMIRSAASRGDRKTAQAICKEALRNDNSLWDVKLTLAQLLLMDRSDDDGEAKREQAIKLAREVRGGDFEMDAPTPTRRKKTKTASTAITGMPANYQSNPMYWSQSSYQLASNLRVGQYANASYSYGSSSPLVEPTSFGHARVIAASLIVMNEAVGKSGEEASNAVQALLDSEFNFDDIDSVTEAIDIWERYALMTTLSVVTNQPGSPYSSSPATGQSASAKAKAEAMRKRQMKLMWKLAELDPANGLMPLLSTLSQRMMSSSLPDNRKPDMTPLTEDELKVLAQVNKQVQNTGLAAGQTMGLPPGGAEMMLQGILGFEFRLAGLEEKAAEFAPQDPGEDAGYDEVLSAIQFYLRLEKPEKADALVKLLLPAARREKPKAMTQGLNPVVRTMASTNESAAEFHRRHQNQLVDAAIACWSKQSSGAAQRSVSLGDGYVRTYVQSGLGFRSVRIRGPLSPRLLDSALAQQVFAFVPSDTQSASTNRSAAVAKLPTDLINHLQKPVDGATREEQKARRVVAAYAHWWANRPEQCYEALTKLCTDYPADVDLQIERARLASELKQPRVALQALDSFNPLDSRMLIRKEMAAMNLAAEIGDTQRAKLAAERLFGMRLDIQMQLALADQLKRLGLNDQANAMLQRTRSGRTRDENTELQIARAFLSAGDQDAAGEVAYSLLRRLSSGRSRNNNQSYYQQQVVSILQSAGRLEPLIERAKRRVESSPKAIRPKQELAELYLAAGQTDKANEVWESLSEDVPTGAPQLIARADALVKAKKNKEALEFYLDAFDKDPSRFNNDYYKMTNAARSAGEEAIDAMFRRLLKFPVHQIPTYRMDELVRLGNRSKLSDAKRDFIGHLLKSPAAKSQVFNIIRNLPTDQRGKIPEYRQAVIDAISSDDAFAAASSMWRVSSRSSGGRAIGPLADSLKLLQSDSDAENIFREAASKAVESETQRRNATFLLALLDFKEPDNFDACLTSIRESIKRESDDKSNSPTVTSGLLWQGGQILEENKKVPVEFLIDLYTEAKRSSPANSSGNPQYSLDCRLVDTYIKAEKFDEAREKVKELRRTADFSMYNTSNPGYGDYQQLQTEQWVAEKLIACKAPIDALIIYRAALADDARFERAQRWGGSRSRKQAFETGAENAASLITADVAVTHLENLLSVWEKDSTEGPIDLMEASPEALTTTESPSSLALAVRVAAGDETAREKLEGFSDRIARLSESADDSWQLAALNLMTACYLGHNGNDTLAAELMRRLPDPESLKNDDTDSIDKIQATELFDLYPVARAASKSKTKSDHKIGEQLVNYLGKVAEFSSDSSIAIALAEIDGDASNSIARILDVIEAQTKPDQILSENVVNQCLQVAKDAARAKQVTTAIRALRLALQNGPPLRKISTTGDAFAIAAQSRSSITTRQQQPAMQQLINNVSAVSKALSEATSLPLSFQKSQSRAEPAEFDAELMGSVADAYLAIFVPANREGTAFAYSKPIATSSYDRINSNQEIVVDSVSMALAKAAAASDRKTSVTEALRKQLGSGGDDAAVAIALVQLATMSKDYKALSDALKSFTAAVDNRLPAADQQTSAPGPVTSITSQMAAQSQKKSEVIDKVMHAIWPIVVTNTLTDIDAADEELKSAIASQVGSLLMRTETLINSDSYTSNRHREIRRRLSEQHVKLAKMSGNIEVIDRYIKSQLNTIQTQAYPSGGNIEEYRRRALESLTTKLIDDGLTNRMDQIFREAITTRKASERNYSNRFEPHICLAISRLPAAEQIELLEKIAFGRSGDQPFAYFDGLVSYEVPPPIVSRQHPWLNDVMNLPTSTEHYPIVNSYLMMIETATALGRTESIHQKLDALTKAKGDEADIGLALLKLEIVRSDGGDAKPVLDEIRPTLDAVAAKLAKEVPTKNDATIAFPAMETHLVVRAYEAGLPRSVAEPMIRHIKAYAIRGQRNFMVSAVARATAKMGVGRAANATDQSPLKHFEIVPIAARYRGENRRLSPLYAQKPDGWISGTSGYDQAHLMFKYPLSGSFTISAEMQDGAWGESHLAYGGVIYQATGWQKTATLLGMPNRGRVEVKVESILNGKLNNHAIRVTPESVEAICNDEVYVSDIASTSFPFPSVFHQKYRTTQFRNLKFTGNPTIPDEVNLIDPSMRGWGVLTRGREITKMLLPIGPKQNRQKILDFRKNLEEQLAKGPIVGKWCVIDGHLHYKGEPASSRKYDPAGQIQYARPLQDGESMQIEFFWKNGKTEFAPTIGRTILKLTDKGAIPDWIIANGDLASVRYVPVDQLDPPYTPIAKDSVPKDDQWNTLVMKRSGDRIAISLNDQALTEIPVVGNERPGIYRYEKRDVDVRSMKLTGPWPKEFPKEWLSN